MLGLLMRTSRFCFNKKFLNVMNIKSYFSKDMKKLHTKEQSIQTSTINCNQYLEKLIRFKENQAKLTVIHSLFDTFSKNVNLFRFSVINIFIILISEPILYLCTFTIVSI